MTYRNRMSSPDVAGGSSRRGELAADPASDLERLAWGPRVGAQGVRFRVADPHDEVDGVRLEVDWVLNTDPEFSPVPGGWALDLPRSGAWRLEYQLTVRRDGRSTWTTDPGNPRRVPNPFGEKSEIRFPEYREPPWLLARPYGPVRPVETPALRLERPVPVRLWSPEGLPADSFAPLLVAHDGSDMADRGSLLSWATELSQSFPIRVALLDPPLGLRHDWYAANPDYADHIARVVLPAIADRVLTGPVIGLGVSLGALAMLTIQRRHPATLSALALQSGSFFTPDLDPQESGYSHFAQVCTAVRLIAAGPDLSAAAAPRAVPVLVTCGAIEENLANNEEMAAALDRQGYPVKLRIVPDAHTMIGWRDAWFPALDELIESVL
jgi:enterochelin esterase-like enzyme